jgi:hypothetical protein
MCGFSWFGKTRSVLWFPVDVRAIQGSVVKTSAVVDGLNFIQGLQYSGLDTHVWQTRSDTR